VNRKWRRKTAEQGGIGFINRALEFSEAGCRSSVQGTIDRAPVRLLKTGIGKTLRLLESSIVSVDKWTR